MNLTDRDMSDLIDDLDRIEQYLASQNNDEAYELATVANYWLNRAVQGNQDRRDAR